MTKKIEDPAGCDPARSKSCADNTLSPKAVRVASDLLECLEPTLRESWDLIKEFGITSSLFSGTILKKYVRNFLALCDKRRGL